MNDLPEKSAYDKREAGAAICATSGVALIVAGLSLIFFPLALIAAGGVSLLLARALLLSTLRKAADHAP